ncbi:hypothetical protein [Nocardiopsis alba]|uniref:hypothetical protein n=1 Tax=Nocardiopsis alba TaxID=53437 RepID=UPI003D755414
MSKSQHRQDFHFPPITNGVDYLYSVIDLLLSHEAKHNPRNLKYVILHLHGAVEVILKHRLWQEGWQHVVEDPDETSYEDFQAGRFRSISLKVAIKVLKRDFGVKITKGEKAGIDLLSNRRNALQHWGDTNSTAALEALSVKVLDFLIRFLEEEFETLHADLDEIREGTSKIKRFVEQRLSRIRPELMKTDFAIPQCPNCTQLALPLDPNELRCRYCSQKWSEARELFDEFVDIILGASPRDISRGADDPTETCPHCIEEMLVRNIPLFGEKHPEAACFGCGDYIRNLEQCSQCFGLYIPDEHEVICQDCFDYLINND